MTRQPATIALFCLFALVALLAVQLVSRSAIRRKPTVGTEQAVSALRVTPQAVDFGEVVQGNLAVATVTISNLTQRTQSLEIKTSCGCASAHIETPELAPFASTILHVAVNSTVKHGLLKEFVWVMTRNRPEEMAMIVLAGQVTRPVDCDPDRVVFGEVRHRRQAHQDVTLRALSEKPIVIESVTTWTNLAMADLVEVTGSQAVVRISLQPAAKTGRILDFVRIALASPRQTVVEIPVAGVYTGELSARPSELIFDELTDENWREIVLQARVEQVDGKPFSIKNVSCTDKHLTTNLEPGSSFGTPGLSDYFLLTVKLAELFSGLKTEAVVAIEGDFAEDGQLEIPIRVIRRH
jgi:hypothetical protein